MNAHKVKRVGTALLLLAMAGMARGVHAQGAPAAPGVVFAMTNLASDNRIVAFRRAADGGLAAVGSVSTGGLGIGTDLDTQGGLRLSADGRFLYAVNAGSDDVTVFAVNGTDLTPIQKIHVGDEPVSLTLSGNLLYVLIGSVAGNGISGFTVGSDGQLTPIAGSFRALSSAIAVPGDIEFSPDGKTVFATHKTTDLLVPPASIIDAFAVGAGGLTSAQPRRDFSLGLRPFSLAFRSDGRLVVAESHNARPGLAAVSSYQLLRNGAISPISVSVPNHQTDSCWIVVSKDGRYVYTANFGAGTISLFRFGYTGDLTLVNGRAAFLGNASQPVDLGISADGRFLEALSRGLGVVASFAIANDGSLELRGSAGGGLPVNNGASGLAAY